MKLFIAALLNLLLVSPSFALSISSEVENGFRYFKYSSDFAFQRLAYRDYQEKHSGQNPTILQLDEMLGDLDWWDHGVGPKTAAWYGHDGSVKPIDFLRKWRRQEISDGRPEGYLELRDKLESKGMRSWEYHPARLGWSSLLFPAHQRPEDLGNDKLISASNVAVCWNRAEQGHTNCKDLKSYIEPSDHAVALRAVDGLGARILAGQCNWQIENAGGVKYVKPKGVSGNNLNVPCSDDVTISIPAEQEAIIKLQLGADHANSNVKIRDQLVVGVGDSFASGEGNPDVPAKLGWTADKRSDWAADGEIIVDQTTNGPVRKAVGDYYAAQWIDRSCHRSAYSHQLRSALHLALEANTRAITFLGYACSGAEVNKGLFQPFQGPEFTTSKDNKDAFQQAQFPLLLSELCSKYDGAGVLDEPLSTDAETQAIKSNRYKFGGVISDKAFRCAGQPAGKGFRRPVDLIYISVGGNDLGFAKWIMAAIMAEGKFGSFFPVLKGDDDPVCRKHRGSCRETKGRWERLKARYALLRDFVDNRLAFSDRGVKPVLLFTYPLPIYTSNGDLCPKGNGGLTIFASRLNSPEPTICLTRDQNLPVLETIAEFTESNLNGSIEKLAMDMDGNGNPRAGWLAITKYRPAFLQRGFCASKVREFSNDTVPLEPNVGCKSAREAALLVSTMSLAGRAREETLHFPNGIKADNSDWRPFEPVFGYRPYRHRTRLVRTMNDTYFTINQLTAGTQQSKASGLLSLQDAAVYGAFHPTAEAHSIFADQFFNESALILQRPIN